MEGERLRQRRKELKLSGEKVARALNTTKVTVSRWEKGISEPNDEMKLALAKLLNTSVSYLIGETDDPERSRPTQEKPAKENKQISYSYWGGILDEARQIADREDIYEISLVAPLLRAASNMLSEVQDRLKSGRSAVSSGISAYNGSHSSYNGNNLTVAKA